MLKTHLNERDESIFDLDYCIINPKYHIYVSVERISLHFIFQTKLYNLLYEVYVKREIHSSISSLSTSALN